MSDQNQSDQYLRKVSLVVTSPTQQGPTPSGAALGNSAIQNGLDLSQLRISFKVTQSDVRTPNTALIRVFNLSDQTAQSVANEFSDVQLQAGYENGAFGTIFSGTIKQVRRGRVSPTDTYLDILAADGDIPYNQAVIIKSLAAGATNKDKLDALAKSMGIPLGYIPDLPPGAIQRGQVMYGMSRDYMSDLAHNTGTSWSIQNGQIQMIPKTGYRPGTAVVLNSDTGLIGLPQQTAGGILAKCLLNPNIKIGALVQINNASIQRDLLGGQLLFSPNASQAFPAFQPKITADGIYRVYVSEFEGDTRGQPFYTSITCLAVDMSAPAATSVQAPA
jgi:hypothetical protein